MRVGFGWDRHRLEAGRPFPLGGVRISEEIGPVGHSDGDPLLHAIIDALLGALGDGDIGDRFPDTEPEYRGIDSAKLLSQTLECVVARKCEIVNLDATVLLETIRLGPLKQQIRRRVAELLGIPAQRVNIKAKTGEKLGPVGRGEAVEAMAVVLLDDA